MKALILAAGRGERLRPLTDHTPKPLIEVRGEVLLDRHIAALAAAGIEHILINTAHLAHCIEAHIQARNWPCPVELIYEGEKALETGGAMLNALPRLGSAPFLVVNGDVYCDVDFKPWVQRPNDAAVHLLMVDNPAHHPNGDFVLQDGRIALHDGTRPSCTYSGIGRYNPDIFADCRRRGAFPIRPLLDEQIQLGAVTGELHLGEWHDIGTPERLAQANRGAHCA